MKTERSAKHGHSKQCRTFYCCVHENRKKLNEITRRPKYIPFRTNARIASRYNTIIESNLEELNVFAELRNCLVHFRDGKEEVIAEPTEDITTVIEEIAEKLQEDHSVLCFAASPVIKAEYSEPVIDVLTRMDESRNSKLPVYEEGKFKGIFSLQQMLHHILTHEKSEMGTVSEILDESTKGIAVFVSRNTLLEEVAQMYEKQKLSESAPTVLLVTENGNPDEEPLGMITMNDLAQFIRISV